MKIIWNIGEGDKQAANSGGIDPRNPHSEAGQVPVGWYSLGDHICKYL